MRANAQSVIEKIRALPPEHLAEVEDYIDFLTSKKRRQAAIDRLLAIAPELEEAGAPPISEQEITAEVEAVRAERRGRGPHADRS